MEAVVGFVGASWCWLLGAGLLARGVQGIVVPSISAKEVCATTPTALALGITLLATACHVLINVVGPALPEPRRRIGRPAVLLTWGVVTASAFWAVNAFAADYGLWRAENDALTIGRQPQVIIDTRQDLYLNSQCVVLNRLPEAPDQQFRFRYGGMRILVEGGDRIFLVAVSYKQAVRDVRPTPFCPVVAVPQDVSVRLQFLPGAQSGPAPPSGAPPG